MTLPLSLPLSLLLVCSANECRSPAAQTLLSARLTELGVTGVRTFTCGHEAAAERPACPDTRAWARSRGFDTDLLDQHRSRRLDLDLIGSADLVLGLDRRARAAVVRLAPAANERTFTLREAAALVQRRARQMSREGGRRSTLIADLHATRGLTDLPETEVFHPPSHGWRAVRIHEHDVPDAHVERGVTHRLSRRLLVPAVDAVARGLYDLEPE
ncbi:hypothetical protein [Nocardioides insulae]|uniref:arsenate reductase/protein-tyrosine-phosphatase family protein n=1 Tax=Nocardioides insulae TaxID=394734 RepID=UPI000400B4C4|nr:hypothetical protein [Nocardioides insulae]